MRTISTVPKPANKMPKGNYDLAPSIRLDGVACWGGWYAVAAEIMTRLTTIGGPNVYVAVECYAGVHTDEIISALGPRLATTHVVDTERTCFKTEAEIDAMCAPDLGGDDPIFGRLTRLVLADFLDMSAVMKAAQEARRNQGIILVVGPAASLVVEAWQSAARYRSGVVHVYADMPRWEGQLRQRRDEVANLGTSNHTLKASLQYKRAFFIDWRVCDKLKRAQFGAWDYYLDTVVPGSPKLITGAAFAEAMAHATTRPFRFTPFFDPGPWGGQWMREQFGLADGPPNYAWCFDCVPEENSLVFEVDGHLVEMPGMNLVLHEPERLMGEPVYGRMGAEFPIRTDFLDTMGGGNLSFQVHPTVDFAWEHFGLRYTQDESYYLLDAGEDAVVYLGLKEDADPTSMMDALRMAQANPDLAFPDERYVARFPAKKHDHFLIPAGTVHCSGSNSMVLEISHTPYIFTFKMWDWGRLGLDGLPRPINLDRGEQVIDWRRRESWVRDNLVNQIEPVAEGKGWREERTGLYPSEMLETRRHWFTDVVTHDTQQASVHVINLVEGAEAVIESPTGAFEPFTMHYAETVCIPAAVGVYTVRPTGAAVGRECATLRVTVRVS